jgi:DNA-binding response OmpR family regulator
MSDQQPSSASVLVVEDDELISSLLTFLLERERYTVHLAADGRAGLEYIQQHAPTSVVLMDVMLPYVDGFELLRQLRANAQWQQTRVIMLSAKSQGSDIARAFDAGADDYLVKPFRPEELFARIRRYRPFDPNPS